MSDYMFMLESHLSAPQNRVVAEVQGAANRSNVTLFLAGGAVRDMLGGFPVRDLDFTVEGNALKLAKAVAEKAGAKIVSADEHRRSAELRFPEGVTAEIAMARQERYPKPAGRPVITPSTIHDDLHCRDFTINAIALSLNPASLGLLLDPTNGQSDLERKELRAVHGRVLYDDPGRILRMIRFRVRFGMTIEERTAQQYENARLEEVEKLIPARRLFEELAQTAEQADPGAVLEALATEKLLPLMLPGSAAQKLNLAGFARLQKVKQMIPFGADLRVDHLALLLHLLTEKMSPSEKSAFSAATAIRKSELDLVKKLHAESKKLERELRSPKVTKASHIYQVLVKAPGEELFFLYLNSTQRVVQDRIRNYLQKYLPLAMEITDRQVAAAGAEPGTTKFKKLKEELILKSVDGRLKKPAPPVAEETPAPPPGARNPHSPMQARGK